VTALKEDWRHDKSAAWLYDRMRRMDHFRDKAAERQYGRMTGGPKQGAKR